MPFEMKYFEIIITAADPCAGALCQTNNICIYGDRVDLCHCLEGWTGPSCASDDFGKLSFRTSKTRTNHKFHCIGNTGLTSQKI